jgi:rhamnose transport system permease protein
MVILGGISIDGGQGSILGVVLSALLIGLVTFGLSLLNVPGIVLAIVTGCLLIGVVAISSLVGYSGRRRRG